jgi:hypothetical protein
MPVNKTGSYSGPSIQKTQTSLGQDTMTGSRTLHGQNGPLAASTNAHPPKTTGSAPTFQNKSDRHNPSK